MNRTHLNSLPSLAGFDKKRFCSIIYFFSDFLVTVNTGSPLCFVHVSIMGLKCDDGNESTCPQFFSFHFSSLDNFGCAVFLDFVPEIIDDSTSVLV